MKPVFPAEQIVMDVKRLNINFTFMEKDKIDSKPKPLSRISTSKYAKPSTLGFSFLPPPRPQECVPH
ncbi:hypothetical protein RUM44_010097 [Polyplax serrata]|uniref:Uncharacterized protein n=1 Tax=Polyplax serrata TaxID=468196 RepID=A0ABR1AUJ5_POLSC